MLDKLSSLESEFGDVERRLADPDVFADQDRYRELARRQVVELGRIARRRSRRPTVRWHCPGRCWR